MDAAFKLYIGSSVKCALFPSRWGIQLRLASEARMLVLLGCSMLCNVTMWSGDILAPVVPLES